MEGTRSMLEEQAVAISFLDAEPTIDGSLAPEKLAIPAQPFRHIIDSATGASPSDATFRVAYGTSFLYVLVQCEGHRITCRDRGYQNGDGFVVVLARPKPDLAPSDEYTLLSFWPQDHPVRPFRTMLWGTNGRWPLTPLPARVRHAAGVEDGIVSLEALIPWEVVPPHHPWRSERIGIDILFARATPDDKTEVYTIAFEESGQSSIDHVRYVPSEIDPPTPGGSTQIFVQCRRNAARDDSLQLETLMLSSEEQEDELVLRLISGEGDYVNGKRLKISAQPGISRQEHSVAFDGVPPGGYRIQWLCERCASSGEFGLSILEPFSPAADADKLKSQPGIDALVVDTIEFHAAEISRLLDNTRPYETCSHVRPSMDAYRHLMQAAKSGESILRSGAVRLAQRSALDQTLQPFTVVLPEGFDPERTYPLLVHLHGSERDDTAVAGFRDLYRHTEMIVLAPYGRGTSNHYAKDNAQDDIREAFEAACRVLPIDRNRVVLAGFSMGGYGVYHTYAENPGTYRGVAPFSGTPTAPWEPDAPDYASDELSGVYLNVPIFVYHGTGDFNVPFETTEKLVKSLRARGHERIEVCLEEGGHGLPSAENTQRFHEWLAEVFELR